MELFVGLSTLRGSIARFPFDLLELTVSPTLPRTRVLREYAEARQDLAFTLRLHPDIVQNLDGAEELLTRAKAAAEALGARAVVVASGPNFGPSQRNLERLKTVVDGFRLDGRVVGWEPRSVFQDEELLTWSESADLIVVRDLTREAPLNDGVHYTRLLPFGLGSRVTQSAFERLATHLDGAERAFVVVQSEGAKGLRTNLRELFELENA